MPPNYFGEIILQLIRIIELTYCVRWNANVEIIERYIGYAFEFRINGCDASIKCAAGGHGLSKA